MDVHANAVSMKRLFATIAANELASRLALVAKVLVTLYVYTIETIPPVSAVFNAMLYCSTKQHSGTERKPLRE